MMHCYWHDSGVAPNDMQTNSNDISKGSSKGDNMDVRPISSAVVSEPDSKRIGEQLDRLLV